MSICSQHRKPVEGCRLCSINLLDDPKFVQKHREALAAGTHTCEGCGFVFYKTVAWCPLCRLLRP